MFVQGSALVRASVFVQPSEFWQNSKFVKTIVIVQATVFAQPSEFV